MKKLIIMIIVSLNLFAATLRTTKDGMYFFTRNKDQLNKILDLAISKDYEALDLYINLLIKKGEGGYLKKGVQVYVEKTDWGLVQFRPKGSLDSFWTVSEAINK